MLSTPSHLLFSLLLNEILSGSAWDSKAFAVELLALDGPVTTRP